MDNKKKLKSLVVIIIVLVILLLGSIAYICYDKGIISFNEKANSKQTELKEETFNYEDSKKVFTGTYEDDEEYYSLIIKVNGNWYEVANNSVHYEILGEYDKKLYYADDEALKYIDLSNKDFKSVTWIKYEEKNYNEENNFIDYTYVDQGEIKDDTIYFIKDSYGYNVERDSYLYSLKLDSNSYSDINKEVKQEGIIDIKIEDNTIYYYTFENLKSYNLDTKETKIILDNVRIYAESLYEDMIIYNSTPNGENDKWYLYDFASGEKSFITTLSSEDTGMFQVYNDAVYYLNNNTIMKYKDGKNEKIYKLDNVRTGGAGGKFVVINDNLFDYSTLATDKYSYIFNGEKATKDEVNQYIETYNVHMMDGEQKTYEMEDIVK